MPTILDNIEHALLPALEGMLKVSHRADFCVGYFNLRGWKCIDALVDAWGGGPGAQARVLVGMQQLPQEELRQALRLGRDEDDGPTIDQQTALRLKKRMAEELRQQLILGAPTNADERGLRKLSAQLKAKQMVVKLYLRHQLHAKLYLLFRTDPITPTIGYLGSSNLTFAGLSKQGELNVDVVDQDACGKLETWFNDRWSDRFCLDISDELALLIDESWARDDPIPPYHIYLNMAYHLSQEAREGLAEFGIPAVFKDQLFEFQAAAVKIAAHHARKRNGVLVGDVVGLGKTMMASALVRIFEDDEGFETLIICPKNLVPMWDDYRQRFGLRATIVPLSQVTRRLPELRRHRVVLIDESHNLRNREGKQYRAIQDYIATNALRTVLLSATPYNKSYLDLSSQLRLFVPEDQQLPIGPAQKIAEMGETQFIRQHQCPVRSIAAFEKSEYPDDWRELMRLYMVRRTRSFIMDNYAKTDRSSGRKYLAFPDGRPPSYFPTRVPKTLTFGMDETDPDNQYAQLYTDDVVQTINALKLPRYGLGNYERGAHVTQPTAAEQKQLDDLSHAGQRLMGFCRTNLFKRLESSGLAFIQSIERHALRNFVFLHAIENSLALPIGPQGADLLDTRVRDEDADAGTADPSLFDDTVEDQDEDETDATPTGGQPPAAAQFLRSELEFRRRAADVYAEYAGPSRRSFKWIQPGFFRPELAADLLADAQALLALLQTIGAWDAARDAKLAALLKLLQQTHPHEKVLVFTQFADTVRYLTDQLKARGVTALEGATGQSAHPTELAWRFSPVSNGKRDRIGPESELRVLVATDVLSEGQNLQDASIIVNYDLPWAIIRLVQRAGRVDRIGQTADRILCYSFLPAEGVDRIIRLRARVKQRLQENAEVVGTDESFFEDDTTTGAILDIYNEKAGIFDGDADAEVDLASSAYQIWKNAIDADPSVKKAVEALPSVVYSTRAHTPLAGRPEGVLVYLRTADGTDALAWIDEAGRPVTQSQITILDAARCEPSTPALPRHARHHELVAAGAAHIAAEEKQIGGGLGRPSGARFKTYERLKRYAASVKGSLFDVPELQRAIDEIYRYPLRSAATDTLNRLLRTGADDTTLLARVLELRDQDRLSLVAEDEDETEQEPQIICSLGLFRATGR